MWDTVISISCEECLIISLLTLTDRHEEPAIIIKLAEFNLGNAESSDFNVRVYGLIDAVALFMLALHHGKVDRECQGD